MLQQIKSGIRNASCKVNELVVRVKCAFESRKAEGYVDSGVKILIAVVIGAILLAGLYALINNDVLSPIHDRIANFVAFEP